MKNISGNLTTLRELRLEDGSAIHNWVQDKEVVKYSLGKWQKQYSKKEFDEWFKRTLSDSGNVNFAIISKEDNKLIGYTGFCSWDKDLNVAEYFIFIGDRNEWGKGYGTEVTKLMVDYGFENLGLKEIILTVSEPNIGGIKAYERAGFIVTGRKSNAALRDGVYHDKLIMKIARVV